MLTTQRTSLVGIMIPVMDDIFFDEIVRHMHDLLQQYGYHYLVASSHSGDIEKIMQNIRIMEERCVDAIYCCQYLTMDEYAYLRTATTIPLVFPFDSARDVNGRFFHTCADEEKLGQDAASYLISLGHKKLGIIYDDKDYLIGRKNGFCFSVEMNGLEADPAYIVPRGKDVYAVIQALSKDFHKLGFPTAWYCDSDEIAVALMLTLFSHGLRVPEDVSVMGCNDKPIGSHVQPKLTTIRQPMRDQSERAVDALMSILLNHPCSSRSPHPKHQLIIRDSCRRVISMD